MLSCVFKGFNIKISGEFSTKEATDAVNEFKNQLGELDVGLNLINDITEFETAPEEALILLKESFEVLEAKKPSRIIRIDKDSSGKKLFDKALKEAFINYKVIIVDSLEQAMKVLEE